MSKAARLAGRERRRAAASMDEARDRGLLTDGPGLPPLAMLVAIAGERTRLAELELQAVRLLRQGGSPWAVIGRALGITGQAAAKRYASLVGGPGA